MTVFSLAPARHGAELPFPKPCAFHPYGTNAPHISRPFTDGREYFTATVDMPIVCETVAAGLGTLGLVIWENVLTDSNEKVINTTAVSLSIDVKF